jgi:hypothetical protein
MSELGKKFLFTGTVDDNEDPYLLGRVRCKPDDWKIQNILDALNKSIVKIEGGRVVDVLDIVKYTKDDPFVFMPLLPPFMSFIPKVGELIWLTYSNPNENWGKTEQFYIPASKTSPFNVYYEGSTQAKALTSQGPNLSVKKPLKQNTPAAEFSGSTAFYYPQKQYFEKTLQGIFAEPGDNAIYGQGTTDIILKENELLMRAGKVHKMVSNLENPVNEKRAFVQLSYYATDTVIEGPKTINTSEDDDSPLRKLIEYEIINIENQVDSFRGFIAIYDISSAYNIKNNEFTPETIVNPTVTQPIYTCDFYNTQGPYPLSAITDTINYIIDGLNEGKIQQRNEPIFVRGQAFDAPHPFYYRPSKAMRDITPATIDYSVGVDEVFKLKNVSKLITKVRFTKAGLDINGSGLVSQPNRFGISKKQITNVVVSKTTSENRNSSVINCGDKVLLLSHQSVIPGKDPINFSKETIYGFTQNQYVNNILPNTNSVVRGEKLKEFLNLIVKFLTTHAHPFHQLPPTPISYADVSVADIESEFQKYDTDVLNQNIRIN